MAIQVSGTQVISNSRGLTNIASVDATTVAAFGAAGVGGGGLEAWNPNATPNQTFTSSGTWSKPGSVADSAYVVFYMVGGGSSGGTYYGGPGGFGGGVGILTATMGGLPSSISVTIGAGGARQSYFGYSTNVGGSTTVSSNSITYTAGGGSGGNSTETIRFPPFVIFPVVESPFNYAIPTNGTATAGTIPSTVTNGVQNGKGSIFAAGDGGNVNPNHNGTGGSSTYAGNGGAGNMTYGATGSVPGGGGGGAYTAAGSTGGAGGNGSVRVYYIT